MNLHPVVGSQLSVVHGLCPRSGAACPPCRPRAGSVSRPLQTLASAHDVAIGQRRPGGALLVLAELDAVAGVAVVAQGARLAAASPACTTPLWHVSWPLHGSWSPQLRAVGRGGCLHPTSCRTSRRCSGCGRRSRAPCRSRQMPAAHVSAPLHGLPSLHDVPSADAGPACRRRRDRSRGRCRRSRRCTDFPRPEPHPSRTRRPGRCRCRCRARRRRRPCRSRRRPRLCRRPLARLAPLHCVAVAARGAVGAQVPATHTPPLADVVVGARVAGVAARALRERGAGSTDAGLADLGAVAGNAVAARRAVQDRRVLAPEQRVARVDGAGTGVGALERRTRQAHTTLAALGAVADVLIRACPGRSYTLTEPPWPTPTARRRSLRREVFARGPPPMVGRTPRRSSGLRDKHGACHPNQRFRPSLACPGVAYPRAMAGARQSYDLWVPPAERQKRAVGGLPWSRNGARMGCRSRPAIRAGGRRASWRC